jgi:hypothetical protein
MAGHSGYTLNTGHSLYSGLVSCVVLDYDQSTTIHDLVDNATLSVTGTPAWNGTLEAYDIGSGNYLEVPYRAGLNPTSALTMLAYVRATTVSADQASMAHWSGGNGYMMYGSAFVNAYVDGTQTGALGSGLTNTWYLNGASWNGTTIQGYQGGTAVGAGTAKSSPSTGTASIGLQIGAYAGANGHFLGAIKLVALWNRALDSTDWSALGSDPFCFLSAPSSASPPLRLLRTQQLGAFAL